MTSLRFVRRNDEKVLQYLVLVSYKTEPYYGQIYDRKYEWFDVSFFEEETPYKNEDDPLTEGL